MVDLFERDAQMLKKFGKAFASSCQKVLNAQVAMISATQEMSYYLRLYGMQNFPLDPSVSPSNSNDDLKTNNSESNSLSASLNQFANYVDEVIGNKSIEIILNYFFLRYRLVFKCL